MEYVPFLRTCSLTPKESSAKPVLREYFCSTKGMRLPHFMHELWFQQDGAACHTARATIDLLKDTFGDRLISRFGPVNWPPRSCDLTPLDYFLWGYVKSLVCVDKPQTLDHLEDNIRRVIADIRPQMLEKSSKIGRPDWTTSEPAVAVLCQKSYLKYTRVAKVSGYIIQSPTVGTLPVNTSGESGGSVRNKIQAKPAGRPPPPFLIGGPDKTKYYCLPYI
ncbi:transposable element Tc3 transposase [Trichonephila clavipes]|nr:transposable element Tc3 transposase [Trichonephila clavipes]